jgi:hypothetical protein
MASYKNISSDWYINVNGGVGTIFIDGNLDVTGNITYVSEIAVNDAFIIVAANNSPTANVTDSGLIATKPTDPQTFAGLRFDTVTSKWQISSNVTSAGAAIDPYQDLASGGTGIPGGNVNDIQINDGAGGFTANGRFQFDTANSKLTVTGHEVLGNIGSAPNQTANSVTIYNNTVGAGVTGLYVLGTNGANTVTSNDELISLTRARLYAIIF